MHQSRTKGIVFGIIMSYAMAFGMEIYNIAVKMGFHAASGGFTTMTYAVFPAAAAEIGYMGVIVFLFSSLFGNRCGAAFAAKVTDPERDNPYFCRLMRQAGTISVMCPAMSLAASVLFNLILGDQPVWNLPVLWIGTMLKNYPMAFFWNMFAAAPFTNWITGKLFR